MADELTVQPYKKKDVTARRLAGLIERSGVSG